MKRFISEIICTTFIRFDNMVNHNSINPTILLIKFRIFTFQTVNLCSPIWFGISWIFALRCNNHMKLIRTQREHLLVIWIDFRKLISLSIQSVVERSIELRFWRPKVILNIQIAPENFAQFLSVTFVLIFNVSSFLLVIILIYVFFVMIFIVYIMILHLIAFWLNVIYIFVELPLLFEFF